MEECTDCQGFFADGALRKCSCCIVREISDVSDVCKRCLTECYRCYNKVCEKCIEPTCECGQLEEPHCKNCNKNPCSAWRHSNY